jgi:hypothetical protein
VAENAALKNATDTNERLEADNIELTKANSQMFDLGVKMFDENTSLKSTIKDFANKTFRE